MRAVVLTALLLAQTAPPVGPAPHPREAPPDIIAPPAPPRDPMLVPRDDVPAPRTDPGIVVAPPRPPTPSDMPIIPPPEPAPAR
jgi:hypothetical protein